MKRIDKRLIETADTIDKKFAAVNEVNREEVSSDILPHIRHFCEAFMYKVYDEETGEDLFQSQDNTKEVRKYFKIKYYDVYKFHTLLDASVGHIDFGKMQSEALTIRYIPQLIHLKDFLAKNYGINVLGNIFKYPLDLDDSITSFYQKILFVLLNTNCDTQRLTRNQYFIRKRSMKYIEGCIFYEYVFDVSDDKANKFNTFVCYSLKNIKFDYDLKLLLSKKEIMFLNTKIYINVIYDYEYSIRPCTFKNILYLLNSIYPDWKRDKDYMILMQMIKNKRMSLLDIIDDDSLICISENSVYYKFIEFLRSYAKERRPGSNVIRFLLYDMRNSLINAQKYKSYGKMPILNEKFNNLRIGLGAKSFELMPFAFNPKNSRPSLHTLFGIFDASDSKDEILYHYLADYINQNNVLFVKPNNLGYSDEMFEELARLFNLKLAKINPYYLDYKIIKVNDYYTIESYYKMTIETINMAISLGDTLNVTLNNDYTQNQFLSNKQNIILSNALKKSSIALLTGAAGTGKTTVIKEFIKNNNDKSILCLTTTNTANNNLKIKDFKGGISYKNVAQFEKEKIHQLYDIVIIDEASFIETKSIRHILNTYSKSMFLIAGDPEQIESIDFGNWFILLLDILKTKKVVYTLDDEYRTKIKEISNVWHEVRKGEKNILELLSTYGMTEKISDDIFKVSENEVVLCLNYDGLYGINNVNRYLQSSNPNKAFEYQQNLYKVGDPVIFITNDYSEFGIYNNLKGKIVEIKEDSENIMFKIRLFDLIEFTGRLSSEVFLVKENDISYAIVEKIKYYNDKYDNNMDSRTKLPFQISYAMSIHKAQGLEFDSVKIVITKEADELITKNIFYTAVTRAKKNLMIYWEPEVANYVLDNIENSVNVKGTDLSLLREIIKK